ncbi:DUF3987 domain-containing protein [Moraxella sp. ZY200743]|uniref:DUF3987 domain-containing protein n=1 Tax=Moraxella sp. ZY200743 TaxID=2911970 RepID=UPI003D7DE916
MKSINEMEYHPTSQKLVKILQTKTQNSNPLFFRVIVAYYMAMITSHMRVNIAGWAGKGTIPINVYAFALSPSGSGKGHSTSLIENEVINSFKTAFMEHTFPICAEQNCELLAAKRAKRNGTDIDDELIKLAKSFNELGALLFSFDSATTPAIKQMRQKLLMANAGSCNLQVDEIGANFSGSIEALTAYLELYDKGFIKDKLVKSSAENTRFERIDGYTPANMLLFGTPSKLLDGARTEEQLMQMLEMGYARRCFFGYAERSTKQTGMSVDEVINQLFNSDHDDYIEQLSDRLALLADLSNMNKSLRLTQDSIKLLVEYKLICEQQSQQLSELENIRKSELEHRYFKVMKLAGAYAFIDGDDEIYPHHVEYAIKLAEDSGQAFVSLMTPQRPYVKLANYLAQTRTQVTLADLDEDLPSFRGSKAQKDEMLMMAIAWGYKNNIIIKKSYIESILFLHADTIDETSLDNLTVSYTNNSDMTTGYYNDSITFEQLTQLVTQPDYHWLSHHVTDGYRKEDNAIEGFNLLVLDVDGSTNLSTAQMLLKKYQAIYYTTKSHTDDNHRFRIILPINYNLKLDKNEYKELYNNVLNDLPFEVDRQCGHRAKKWLSNPNALVIYTEGELFDILPYIPKTSKNEERERILHDQNHLDNLERWVINNTGDGNRNNMLLRYAFVLVDGGFSFDIIKEKVISLNNKLSDKLDELELHSTIFHTVAGRLAANGKI